MSKSEGAPLLPLAESIADGSAVDWEAAEARATSDERAIIQQLRVLSNLAGLHRSMPRRAAARPPLSSRVSNSPAIGSWGHLALLERLGGGTFGDVYRVWDNHLEREVALKLLRIDDAVQDLQASRIATEGRLLARVRHPNVITVHGVDVHDHRVGLWMELVRGATLEQRLHEHGPFSAREAALVGIDLCRALAAIHAAGLIHRDVKAQNVMREDGGRIVLMDLGTGRETNHGEQRTPDLAGTPLYLAPEIFAGASASERTDLYSLGVLLYHLATGSFPVRATTIEGLRQGHTSGARVLLRDARADLPTAFVRAIDRAIGSDPSQRYESAGELERDLLRTIDESPRADSEAADADRAPRLSKTVVWKAAAFSAAAAAAAILTIATPALRSLWGLPRAVIASRDAILVSDFVNTTGEAVFDGTLKEALTVEIQQSPFVNALGARSVEIAASTSGRPTSPAQTAAAARDLCRRQHLKAIVLGTIAAVEKGYRVTVQAQDCQTGQPIAEGSGEASSKTTVLRALGVATAGLRANLGETPASIQRFSVPVDEATTGSLDALKAYSVGMDTRARVGDAEAIPFFNHAVELDPRFALAEGKLASIYANLHEFQQSQAHTKRAYELSDHVTERERLYIRGSYHLHVTGNLDEAMGAYRLWMQLYPQDWLPRSNLGALYARVGRFDQALSELSAGRTLGPDQLLPHLQIAQTYVLTGRFEDATATVTAARSRGLDSAAFRALRVSLALVNGGVEEARREFELPANSAKEYTVVTAMARAEAFGGDVAAARNLIAQAVAKAKAARVHDFAAGLIAEDALNAAVSGEKEYARAAVDRALAVGRGSDPLWAGSLANAFAGRPKLAEQLAAEYLSVTPPTAEVVAVSGPVLQAAAALARGHAARALDALQPAVPYERIGRFWPAYVRGLAYLHLRRPVDAVNQFRDILAHRGDDPASVLFPLAQLEIARALAAAGDAAGAREAYGRFIEWRGSPRGQPLTAVAIQEQSRLPR